MKYVSKKNIKTDKNSDKNVNVSNSNYLREFFELLAGLFVLILSVYLVLVLVFEVAIRYNEDTSTKYLSKFSKLIVKKQGVNLEKPSEKTKKLQKIVNLLLQSSALSQLNLRVHVVDKQVENAFALAGGDIVVFQGLIDKSESENELSMILAHEIAHHEFKHYLKVASRVFPLILMASINSSDVYQSLLKPFFTIATGSFSRKQELDSDKRALEIINNYYGHVAGSMAFFNRSKKEEYSLEKYSLSRTHPVSQSRIDRIKKLIRENKYKIRKLKPLTL